VEALPEAKRDVVIAQLRSVLGPLRLRYTPITPTVKQEAFLRCNALEVLFGGAAGGGKSAALLAGALQYVDVPGYAAILFRRSYTDLALPGALMDRADQWLAGTDARWIQLEKTWEFPSSATITFAYLSSDKDRLRYQSAEFQYIAFDECTQFTEVQYRYLFSRLRKPEESSGVAPDGTGIADVPLRMRSGSNPGGPGHGWVRKRLVDPKTRKGVFIPARLEENPHLNQEEYEVSLENLPPVERQRLRHGDWDAVDEGLMFQRGWFRLIDSNEVPPATMTARYWDVAATDEDSEANPDPDWTVGLRMSWSATAGRYTIEHIAYDKTSDPDDLQAEIARSDGPGVPVREEMEPGSSGKSVIKMKKRSIFRGYDYDGVRSTGAKDVRARPVAAAARPVKGDTFGMIQLVRGPWVDEFLDQVSPFPGDGYHDDMVDAMSGAFEMLAPYAQGGAQSQVAEVHLPPRRWAATR
jgi:predicted phage terminase large subunit-like protein